MQVVPTWSAFWKRFERPIRYGLVGVVNTLVGLGVIYGCKFFGHMSDVPANVLGYVAGVAVSFTLNSTWSFRYRGRKLGAAWRFILAVAVSYAANLTTVIALSQWGKMNGYLAQAAGMPVYTVCLYVLSQTYVFRQPKSADETTVASAQDRRY